MTIFFREYVDQKGLCYKDLVVLQTQPLCAINKYASEQRFKVQLSETVLPDTREPKITFWMTLVL